MVRKPVSVYANEYLYNSSESIKKNMVSCYSCKIPYSFCFSFLFLCHFLIWHHTISHDTGIVEIIVVLLYGISRIPFHCINSAALAFFHDAYMVWLPISIPVKEDEHSGSRRTPMGLLFPFCLEPVYTVWTKGEPRHCPTLNEPALVCAPWNKAGAP